MLRVPTLCAALTLALVLAACGRPPAPQASIPAPGTVEDAAPPAPPAPGKGYLKLRKIYDYVGDRAGTPWASFELNGDYNYPEPIFGGWPMLVTPVDASGNPTGPVQEITTLQELSPTDGRYVELAAGRYRVEERLPTSTSGGGVWSVTGANASQGDTTTAAGAVTSQVVNVRAGQTTVARFFNVCRVNGQVQSFPEGALADINTFQWVCKPTFGTQPGGPSGSLDSSFGGDGRVVTDLGAGGEGINDILVQPDGKIVVAGGAGPDVGDFVLARYTPVGSLDSSFGGDGVATVDFGSSDTALAVALQPDGKVVVVGFTGVAAQIAVARLNPDGSLDASLDGDGRLTTDIPDYASDIAYGVAVQPDGKIVVTGQVTGSNASGVNPPDFVLVRYTPAGSLDLSFDGDGVVGADLGNVDRGDDLAVQPDGKIVVAVSGVRFTDPSIGDTFGYALLRYNPDGSLDPSFGTGGRVNARQQTRGTSANALALQPDGKIVVVGSTFDSGSSPNYFVSRFNADGTRDSSFIQVGGNPGGRGGSAANDVVLQPDGKIVVAGSTDAIVPGTSPSRSGNDFFVARVNASGGLDTGFGTAGAVVTDFNASEDRANAVALLPGGGIVAAGSSNGDFALARYLP